MKPRIVRFFRPLYRNSQSTRWHSTAATQRLSLSVVGRPSKTLVLDALRKHQDSPLPVEKNHRASPGSGDAIVILASQEFATWLSDDSFVSKFLETLSSESRSADKSLSLDVLTGVTDGIGPERLLERPRRGFSILRGSRELLPGLWESAAEEPRPDHDAAASVALSVASTDNVSRRYEATLPLANTLFQNGRRSTLFATRWEGNTSGTLTITGTREKAHQRVEFTSDAPQPPQPNIPLLPITPPRKIVAGLGNIIRQVEIDGAVSPASKELEMLIPQLFEMRAQREATFSLGPVGVWAWIMPPHVASSEAIAQLRSFLHHRNVKEATLCHEASRVMASAIEQGCRLHKILSGGGGWGAKQGLLSLDPEISYSAADQDNIDIFIKSFEERGSQNQSEGLVSPGSYVMFCAEPAWSADDIRESVQTGSDIIAGVSDANELEMAHDGETSKVEVIPDQFGVVSSGGIYLTMEKSRGTTDQHDGFFSTKIDVPRAVLGLSR
ncbi:hypothetical protein BX600DRAFT_453742 [Xylariales sp. PMI_506]|nr:hypothetical protein BX600DRAFT_453742 [Xylariales sp. PMI_506]